MLSYFVLNIYLYMYKKYFLLLTTFFACNTSIAGSNNEPSKAQCDDLFKGQRVVNNVQELKTICSKLS